MKKLLIILMVLLVSGQISLAGDNGIMIVLVDDDFKPGCVEEEKKLLDSLGIKCTFAAIPRKHDGEICFTEHEKQIIREWQEEGFSFVMHPIHNGWYTNSRNEFLGIDYCENILRMTIEAFEDSPAEDWHDYIVYPGGCNSNPEMVEMMAKYCKYGIAASKTSLAARIVPNEKITQYSRVFLSPGKYTVEEYKQQIRDSISDYGFVILGTHSWQYDKSNYSILIEILEYAKRLGKFVTLQEALEG